MYDSELRLIILSIGFLIIVYIIFSNKSNRKYKVYKTKNYDIKNPIDIRSSNKSYPEKNVKIQLTSATKHNNLEKEILITSEKPKQMSLPLGANKKKYFIIINSVANSYYNIKDIYEFMDKKSIFINNNGYYEKYHNENHIRCVKYSVTNMVNPGYLDREKLESFKIRGISFFMQLPLPLDSNSVFSEMLFVAKAFTKKYKGNLYDENKQVLDNKIIENLKNIVSSYKNEF